MGKFTFYEYFKIINFKKFSKHAHNLFNTKIIILQIFRNLFDFIWTNKSKVTKKMEKQKNEFICDVIADVTSSSTSGVISGRNYSPDSFQNSSAMYVIYFLRSVL